MTRTAIHGQIASTLRNVTFEDVVSEVKQDFAAMGGDGELYVTSAASVSAETNPERVQGRMRAVDGYAKHNRRLWIDPS